MRINRLTVALLALIFFVASGVYGQASNGILDQTDSTIVAANDYLLFDRDADASGTSTVGDGTFRIEWPDLITEIAADLSLQNLQGAVTDAQVPNSITIDLATLATTATTANAGDSATSFFSSGEIADARISNSITASNYLLLAGGSMTGELGLAIGGVEFLETDTITDCSSFSTTGGGFFFDDSEGKFKKCEDNVLSDLAPAGGSVSFSALTAGTNTQSLVVGSSGTLDVTGTGTITATNSDAMTFAGVSGVTLSAGVLGYDTDDEALVFRNNESEVTLQIGQEMWIQVYNDSGSTITDGMAVYISGNNVGTSLPTIALARADSTSTLEVVGLATHSIENNTVGYVTSAGKVNGLDTSSFSNGDELWLSSVTAGELVNTAPVQPNFDIVVGVVTRANASQGSIQVVLGHEKEGSWTAGKVAFGCDSANGFLCEDAELDYDPSTDTLGVGKIDLVGATAPTPTDEGLMEWETDDDHLLIGSGSATMEFIPQTDMDTEAEFEALFFEVVTPSEVAGTLETNMAIIAPTTAEDGLIGFSNANAITITEIRCWTNTGTVSINLEERAEVTPNTVGTAVLSSALVCDNNNQVTTTFANATLAAQTNTVLMIDAVASTPGSVNIVVEYTLD